MLSGSERQGEPVTMTPESILLGAMAMALMQKLRLSKKERGALTDDVIARLEQLDTLVAVTPLRSRSAPSLYRANVREALKIAKAMGPIMRA